MVAGSTELGEAPPLESHAREGFFLVDHERRVVGWSPGIQEILGIQAEEALGQPCYKLMRRFRTRDPLPCSRECWPMKAAVAGEAPVCVLRREHSLGAWSLLHESVSTPRGEMLLHRIRDVSLDVISIRFLRRVLEALEGDVGEIHEAKEKAYLDNLVLTRREVEVLRLMAEGMDTRTISRHMAISYFTARNYIQNLLSKLNAHNRVEAVVAAQRLGLLSHNGNGAAGSHPAG